MNQNENKPINLMTGVPHKYIQKPYYGNMYFKIVYDVRDPKEHKRPAQVWTMSPSHRRDLFYKAKTLASAVNRFCKKELIAGIRHRTENNKLTVFLEKEEHARAVLKQFDKNIIEIHVPYNNMQIQIGNSDMMATPLFRARLFEQSSYCKGFRYKVQVLATSEVRAMSETLTSFFSNINKRDYSLSHNMEILLSNDSKRKDRLQRWNSLSMYFNDEQDLLMLKLMLGGTEMDVYKVILHRELVAQDK